MAKAKIGAGGVSPAGEALAAELLAAEEEPAALVERLKEAEPGTALAVISALGRSRQPRAVGILLAVAESEAALPSRLRKEARRELHRLRALGLDVPPPRPQPAAEASPARLARAVEAWVSPSDGVGSRGLWLAAERPLGGIYAVGLILNDIVGMKACTVDETTRRRFRERLERLRSSNPLPLVSLPPDYARQLIGEALELNGESGFTVPREFQVYQRAIEDPAPPFERALVYQEIPATEVALNPELLEESPALLEEPELKSWFFGFDEVRGHALNLLQARQSQIVLSEQLKAEREQRILADALRDVVTPAVQRGLRRRLEETAYVFLRTERPHQARLALAAAQRLAEGATSLHPLLQAMMRTSLELASEVETAQVPLELVRRSAYDPVD